MMDGVVEREEKDHSEAAWLSLSSTIQTTIHSNKEYRLCRGMFLAKITCMSVLSTYLQARDEAPVKLKSKVLDT